MIYDYYSIPFTTETDAQAVIDTLDAVAIDGPFQIPDDVTGGWYFNVRSALEQSGEWIASQVPDTPFRIWA